MTVAIFPAAEETPVTVATGDRNGGPMYGLLAWIGVLLMILTSGGIVVAIYLWRNPDVKTFQDLVARLTGVSERPPEAVLKGKISPSDQLIDAPMGDRLQVALAKQAITLDGTERTIQASVDFKEYYQEEEGQGPFLPKSKGLNLKALVLNGVTIFKLRRRESGTPIWLISEKVVEIKLMTFYVGPKGGPGGPARVFRFNGQETPVPYNFPGARGCPSGVYSVVDIGRLKAGVTGNTDFIANGDFFPFVLSREGTEESGFGNGWTVYLDPRDELASGSGGLFVCREFIPDQEVEDLL